MKFPFSRILQALALLMLFGAVQVFSPVPASAQRIEFDIFEQSDFDKLIASGKPVIVHLNTTW